MREIVRSFKAPTLSMGALTLGSVVLWGMIEFVALQRSQLKTKVLTKH